MRPKEESHTPTAPVPSAHPTQLHPGARGLGWSPCPGWLPDPQMGKTGRGPHRRQHSSSFPPSGSPGHCSPAAGTFSPLSSARTFWPHAAARPRPCPSNPQHSLLGWLCLLPGWASLLTAHASSPPSDVTSWVNQAEVTTPHPTAPDAEQRVGKTGLALVSVQGRRRALGACDLPFVSRC